LSHPAARDRDAAAVAAATADAPDREVATGAPAA